MLGEGICQFCISHFTHSFLMSCSVPPLCSPSRVPLSVPQILLFCPHTFPFLFLTSPPFPAPPNWLNILAESHTLFFNRLVFVPWMHTYPPIKVFALLTPFPLLSILHLLIYSPSQPSPLFTLYPTILTWCVAHLIINSYPPLYPFH